LGGTGGDEDGREEIMEGEGGREGKLKTPSLNPGSATVKGI